MHRQLLKIAPSILAADFARLGEEVRAVDEAGADWIHVDVMDGHFVPNITFGPDMVKAIRPFTDKVLDVHFMIAPADAFIAPFARAGADSITIHAEAGPHLHRSLQEVRALGKKAGAVINPATPVGALEHVIDELDLILIMGVDPGFGGQKFIGEAITKVRQARALAGTRDIDIEIDGGVSEKNAGALVAAGANVLVAGSAIYSGNDPATYGPRIAAIRNAAEAAVSG
jgi:ribulose-phosphate 3-epimerase